MMDLTKSPPRSVRATMLGIVQLARTTDKAQATANGRAGEYEYGCPMDQGLFEYLGMDAAEFFGVVKSAKNDSVIEAYANTFVARKDRQSLDSFNRSWVSSVPTGESLKAFYDLRAQVAPNRTDVTSWSDLLDIEEGRTVPRREVAHA
ncbi:MAG: DUF5069 domain-containing protein [Candidatus Baltobacteraceae bacterium]